LAGAVFREINGLAIDRSALARESAQAEWYVGTRGGALDHTTICLAERQHAVHLSYADNRVELVPLPATGYRWVTFFSHAADKGREVLHAYNERAAVARLLIPAWLHEHSADTWAQAVQSDDHSSLEAMLTALPAALTPAELATLFPATWHEYQRLFPALLAAGQQQPLLVRPRALHHWGEVRRVREAVQLLRQDGTVAMQKLGELLHEAHASLRDLYEVSTPLVNQLHALLVAHPGVLGARLIGGGFGGNVLALTREETVADLLSYVQKEFYAPQNRDARTEGAIMISTPGAGLAKLF
jgi:galactokinase